MDFSQYKGIYVICEAASGTPSRAAAELLGEARLLAEKTGDTVAAVLIGSGVEGAAKDLVASGADTVYVLESPLLSHYDGKAYEAVLGRFLKEKQPSAILFAADAYGRDLAPRIASYLVCGVTADVTELSVDEKTGLIIWSRPAMGGNIMADIVSPSYRPQMGTIRPGTFPVPAPDASRKGEIVKVPVEISAKDFGTVLREILKAPKEENPVETAKIIVAGGRGIHTEAEWAKVRELADLLGAAVGVTRPIAELGWEPHSRQIGQTGKAVAPHIYIALGISGAMQHVCALKPDILVAVNRDKNAPIMEMADYAVTADLKEFLPALIAELKELKKE